MTTWTHRDEMELKAQLELKLRKNRQEEGVTHTPVAKPAQGNGAASTEGFDAFSLHH